MQVRVSHRVPRTTAEGPHTRYAIWLSGCSLHCPGCCNPELFDGAAGEPTEVDAILAQIDATDGLEGITLLGGEPLQQLPAATALCEGAQARGLGVLVFTGYRMEEARALEGFDRLWRAVDTLVDGRFDARQLDHERRFIGSRNQTLVHRTKRYADPELWRGDDRVEVRIGADGVVTVHGEPGLSRRVGRVLGA